jgi:hypothetical protein
LTALNLLPSIATSSPPKSSSLLHKRVNSQHTRFMAFLLSFLKSAIVSKSGLSFLKQPY